MTLKRTTKFVMSEAYVEPKTKVLFIEYSDGTLGLAKLEDIESLIREKQKEAHMKGWHEGRAAANNPELSYSYINSFKEEK